MMTPLSLYIHLAKYLYVGGTNYMGTSDGVFAFSRSIVEYYYSNSFRVVLTP